MKERRESMTAQNFENVFQKISLSFGVQEAFQGTEVRKLTIHKKERTVSMEISAFAAKYKNSLLSSRSGATYIIL